ncbi:MAG: ATP-dependent Clp protease adaptor ClpS [Desulfovibrio sp.]|jgi:ATP-dependent Clp protease adaptor protein ClpS|nr:ATP-dependent Clp protease adaptor ClpS [Desulfovibrio sp.]
MGQYKDGNNGYGHEESGGLVVEKKLKEPDRYAVLLHNDDYTSMDFVVGVICSVFHKTHEQAAAIMVRVHKQGIGQCGIFTREIAETRVRQVRRKAQEAGFPLKCTMEKV